MGSREIFLYGTRSCGYCAAARKLLMRKNFSFSDIALDENPELRTEILLRSGRKTVPQIWIGDQHVGGYTELFDLDRCGELDRQLSTMVDNRLDDPA